MIDILRKMTYGHYILTALKEGDDLKTRNKDYIAAGTINWASQVSFTPSIVAVAVEHNSDLNETIDYSEHFTLHLLGQENEDMIKKFATKSEIEEDKINGVPFTRKDGEVIFENTVGYVTCKLRESVNVGDHRVHFGEVVKHEMLNNKETINTNQTAMQYSD